MCIQTVLLLQAFGISMLVGVEIGFKSLPPLAGLWLPMYYYYYTTLHYTQSSSFIFLLKFGHIDKQDNCSFGGYTGVNSQLGTTPNHHFGSLTPFFYCSPIACWMSNKQLSIYTLTISTADYVNRSAIRELLSKKHNVCAHYSNINEET